MSKYNLIDIFEQYKIGSGWTNDFDYDGMLNTGLGTSIDTPIEVLKKIFEDFTDVNYHREAEHLHYAIEAIEIGDMMEAQGKISDFHAEIKKTQGDQGMDMSDDLGAYMASKMDLDEDKYDDIVDADDDIPADKKKAAAAAYRKVDKGASYEKATSHIKEVSSREGSRIEGLLDRELKRKFIFAFEDLYTNLIEDDIFDPSDVIEHLGIELEKHIDSLQGVGDRFAGIEEAKPGYNEDGTPKSNDEMGDDEREDFYNDLDSVDEGSIDKVSMKDVVLALIKDAKGTNPEIDSYVKSLKQSGDKFDSVDDYVEDFKNYVADKSLQEHFGRFMKDYQ